MFIKFRMDTFSSFEDWCCMQNCNLEFSKYKKGHNSVKIDKKKSYGTWIVIIKCIKFQMDTFSSVED